MQLVERIWTLFQDPRLGLDASLHTDTAANQIGLYLEELEKWNQKFNLTAQHDALSILDKHVFDSLQYAKAMESFSKTMDIGSGAGFPGIPLKAIFPDMPLVLVESQKKRVNFLRAVIRKLRFEHIEILHSRAEDVSSQHYNRYSNVVFKAVGPLKECLKWGQPFLNMQGRLIIKKEIQADRAALINGSEYSLVQRPSIHIVGSTGIPSELLIFGKCSA
jgi:16S rRNA (guanine527-N7)-methyltransferase